MSALYVRMPATLRATVQTRAQTAGVPEAEIVRRAIESSATPSGEVRSALRVFGQGVKCRRQQRRLSLRAAADVTGISYSLLSMVERGELLLPEPAHARLCDWLGVNA